MEDPHLPPGLSRLRQRRRPPCTTKLRRLFQLCARQRQTWAYPLQRPRLRAYGFAVGAGRV